MYSDLREFLKELEKMGDLIRVRDEIADGHFNLARVLELGTESNQ